MLTKLRNYWKQKENINKLKKDNKGSSFVLVMVSVALIMILVAILFVMIIMQYRMVSLSRQSKDNFYYLEEVLGEIRAGVGNESVNQLKTAYDETVAMVVHYDTNQQKYMSVNSDAATNIMKNKFNNYIAKVYCSEDTTGLNDSSITQAQLISLLTSYVKDLNVTSFETQDGVKLDLSNVSCKAIRSDNPASTLGYRINNVKVSRVDRRGNEQSIQTDISIYPPETALNFLATADDIENIFTYALVADYGVTVSGGDTTDVRVVGNVYAAADYRNNGIYGGTVVNTTTPYTIIDSKPGNVVGNVANLNDESMYSGIFVTGLKTSLNMQSDIVAVNGSIAAKDGAVISGSRKAESSTVDSGTMRAASLVWANNIVTLGSEENNIDLYGTFNIADDLEVNAEQSSVKLSGEYYGYNYAAEEEFDAGSTANYQITTAKNAKSHTNSSAIIVNGEKSSLDLSAISTMLVNGRAYIDINSQKSHENDTITNDVKTAESVAAKGTQLVYRVIDSRMMNENLLTLSTEGTDKAGTQDLEEKYPSSNVIRFLVHQFFEDGGTSIYTSNADGTETYKDYWSGVSKDDVLQDITADGKDSKFYKDIMAVYFPTTQVISGTKNSAGDYIYKISTRDASDMIEVTSCYNKTYKIWKNNDEIPVAGNKTVHQYGFITIGEDYDEVAVVEMKTGTSESTYYFYQFYDDTAKQYFVKDYVAYSAKEDGVTDINSDELFESAKIVMPDYDLNTVYTRGLYTLKEEDESKYTLKDSFKSRAFSEAELKSEYETRLNLSRVYKCNFPRMNSTIGTEMIQEAQDIYENGTRTASNAKFDYATKDENISPLTNPSSINIDWNEVQSRSYSGDELEGYNDAKVWVTSGDVTINGATDGSKINGIVLCMGNVSIKNVDEFRGSIICAGKVSIEGQTNIYADEQLCNNMLVNDTNNMIRTCFGMVSYDSSLNSGSDEGRPISSITYTDLVGYENWIKNGE